MPPYDSAALHFVKTGETGGSPASASPVLAPETLPESLASAAASVMRWPPMLVWPLVGQANSSLLPSLLSLPAQKPEQRGPRDPNNARQTASLSSARTDSGWTSTAGPAEAGRLALWRKSVAPLAVRVPR